MAYTQLVSTATSSGPSAAYEWYGGTGAVITSGMGTGAVTLQCSHDNSNWVNMFRYNSTAALNFASGENGSVKFSLPGPMWIRADITTGSSTGMNVWIISG